MNKLKIIFFISLLISSFNNSLNATLKLPPLKKYPTIDKKLELQKKFMRQLEKKDLEKILLLLEANPFLVNTESYVVYCRKPLTKKYFPILYYAMENKLFDLALLLITKFGADINWQDKDGNFLLDIVTQEHCSEMISLLARYGARQTPRHI